MAELMTTASAELAPVIGQPADQNPALLYLGGLADDPGRRTMRGALDTVARLIRPGLDAYVFPWGALRFQHTAAIRARLAGT